MAYQLRILAGANKGAMCPLADGEYSVGTDEDCDLILADPSVAERHVVITIADGAISLSAEAPVWVGDDMVTEGDSADIDSFQPFRVGGSVLAVGEDDADWPKIDTEAILNIGGLDDDAGNTAGDDEAADEDDEEADTGDSAEAADVDAGDDAADGDGDDTGPGAPPAGPLAATDGPAAGTAAEGDGRGLMALATVVALLSVLGLGAAVYLIVAPPDMDMAMAPKAADPLTTVRQALDGIPGAEHVRAVKKPNGRIDVEGVVVSRQQVVMIRGRLRNLDALTSIRVQPLDELLRSASGVLAQLNAPIEARVADGGRAIGITGFLPTNSALANLKALLARDLPGAPLDFTAVITMEGVRKHIGKGLGELGLAKTVSVEPAGNVLRLTGVVASAAAKAQLATVLAYAKDEYGRFVRFDDKTTVAAGPVGLVRPGTKGGGPGGAMHVKQVPEPHRPGHGPQPGTGPGTGTGMAGAPQFHVVVAGEKKFIKDSNGVRYGLGDKLPDGFVVISIEADLIVAERNGNKRSFKIGN